MKKMKKILQANLIEFFWDNFKKKPNSFSSLIVNNLGNGSIKCLWKISPIDKFRIKFSKSCFYAIRLFDISNNRNIQNATCIMKEIQVSQFQSSISFPVPINKGVYYFEFGYRKRNGKWRKLAFQTLNLGYRIKKVIQSFDNDNWFPSKIKIGINDISYHEKAYQLSIDSPIGGSEGMFFEK